MTEENKKDTQRAIAAVRCVLDGRDPHKHGMAALVTMEHTVALMLLAVMDTPEKAVAMLNEGLVQGVEERLALYNSKAT